MSPMAGNAVMDILFGKIAPNQPNGLSSPATNHAADGSGFADLLSLLSGIAGDQSGLPATDLSFADGTTREVFELDLTAAALGQGNPAAALSTLIPVLNMGTVTAEAISGSAGTNTDAGATPAPTDQSTQQPMSSMLLPKEAVLTNPQVLALLNQAPVALPTGRFAVLSSNVTAGTLQMEVASQDAPNQTIKLSIPTALLHQTNTPQSNLAATAAGVAGQTAIGGRIPLADPFASTERFDQLLAKVNVKEIEISPSHINVSGKEPSAQVTVALAAENNGVPIALTGRMNKNQITANALRRPQILDSVSGMDNADVSLANTEVAEGTSGETKSPIAVATPKDEITTESLTKVIDKSDGVASRTTGIESSMAGARVTRQPRGATAATLDRPAVRMTIQQEMPSLSQLEGRTLMIKLEPEYLGTARLHLTMRQDTLSARVMVETPQAKAAVESSLSQLTDQLTKAGIKIDYIDVGVRGGGAQNQFFHKQSNWFRAQNPRIALSRDIEAISPDLSKTGLARPMVSYVAADRVNIYA